eukprot:5364025-Amphidinium_carterae.2
MFLYHSRGARRPTFTLHISAPTTQQHLTTSTTSMLAGDIEVRRGTQYSERPPTTTAPTPMCNSHAHHAPSQQH